MYPIPYFAVIISLTHKAAHRKLPQPQSEFLSNCPFIMQITERVMLGPLTKEIYCSASWGDEDEFPSSQEWADEVERVLSFLEAQGQFDRYLPRLRGKLTQRDGALAEARVAFFFHRNGFKLISWEPRGASSRVGEFKVQWNSLQPIFIEVKGPRWEGELSEEELKGPRRHQPRYINSEARWFDSIGKVIAAAEKAVPKFLSDEPNLLVVVGYLLFVSPRELPRKIVEPRIKEALSDSHFKNIGGILIFDLAYNPISYEAAFIENVAANELCKIHPDVVKGLSMANEKVFRR